MTSHFAELDRHEVAHGGSLVAAAAMAILSGIGAGAEAAHVAAPASMQAVSVEAGLSL